MATTTNIEKDKLRTENYTPLKSDFFSDGEEVEQIPTVFNNPHEISIETGNDHALDIEVSPFMNSRQEVAEVSSDLKDFVSPVDSTRFRNFESVNLPLSEKQINDGLKQPISSSFRWFAELAKSIFLRKTKTA